MLFTLLISCILCPKKLDSCGFYLHGEDVRVYLFSPTATEAEAYSPFFYTSYFLNDQHHDWYDIPNENIEEWYQYLNGNASRESIRDLVYHSSFEELQSLEKGTVSKGDKLCENEMAEYITNQEISDLGAYLSYTRKTEILVGNSDPWSEREFDNEAIEKHLKLGRKRLSKTKDLMLKQRYAYHLIVMSRYTGKYEKVVGIYEKYFSEIPKEKESIIKYWALSHVAFCQEELGDEDAAHLNYARVFMNCHAKKNWAYNHMSRKSVLSVLGQAKNDEDKMAVHIFSEFRNPARSYEGLKSLSKINPNNEMFKTLVAREVNKLEDWVLTRRYTEFDPSIVHWSYNGKYVSENYKSDFKYLEKIIGFLEQLLLDEKVEDRGFYELVLAHLYFIHESPEMSKTYLKRAEQNVDTRYEKNQFYLTSILNEMIFEKNFDAAFETTIWQYLEFLQADKEYMDNTDKNLGNLMLALHNSYHQAGKHDRAAMFIAWCKNKDWNETDFRYWPYIDAFFYLDRYASVEEVIQFEKWYNAKDKTDFETFLFQDYDYSKARFWDLIGTKYLRNNQLDKALAAYKKVPSDFWYKEFYYHEYLGLDLFAPEHDDVFMGDEYDHESPFINKAYLVEQLINKHKDYRKSRNIDRAALAFELGNAYYNLSYNGSHWHAMAYIQTSNDYRYSYFGQYDDDVNDNYNDCKKAIGYYEEAFEIVKNAEEMSDEGYLARKIIYAVGNIQAREVDDVIPLNNTKYFANLRLNHPTYYQLLLEECPGLDD